MPKKFDQDTKDRVVSLGGRPHSGGEYVHAASMQNCGAQTGGGGSWLTAWQWAQAAHREGRVPEHLPEDLAA